MILNSEEVRKSPLVRSVERFIDCSVATLVDGSKVPFNSWDEMVEAHRLRINTDVLRDDNSRR